MAITWAGRARPRRAAPPKEVRTLVEAGLGALYSPDGKWLAYKSDLLKLGVMSTAVKTKPNPEGDYSHAAFTADSKFLAAVDFDKKVQFLNVATGKPARGVAIPFKNANGLAQSLAVSHDGKKLAVTVLLGGGLVFDVAPGGKPVELEKCIAHRLAFSPDDATLVGFDGDGKISTWDVATGKQVKSWAVAKRDIVRCAFSGDGKLAAAAEADTGVVRLWDLVEGKELGQLQNLKFVSALALTRDGKTLAVGCGEPKAQPEVKLWDVGDRKELDGLKQLPARVLSLDFSPDGKALVVGTAQSADGKAKAATRLFSMP